ncbi:unnamed protein product [Larinioides sclopetarius]|uniref:Methyltransferase domain-containing protein n=1 Tax=Larinioides sclopetarius TaxID=280406 RepID=A0AAV2ATP7_9ARAC
MEEKHKKLFGYAVVGAFGTVAVGLMIGSIPFVMPAFRRICLPFVPATDNQVRNVISLLKKRKGNVIDLGSGDGRIVLAAAKMGFPAVGVELNPWLVIYSKIKTLYLGLSDSASFQRRDIWKTDLKKYDNIVIFGVEQMVSFSNKLQKFLMIFFHSIKDLFFHKMAQLEEKLCQELKKDGCVIACRFPLPNWSESLSVGTGIDTVWLYERKSLYNNQNSL